MGKIKATSEFIVAVYLDKIRQQSLLDALENAGYVLTNPIEDSYLFNNGTIIIFDISGPDIEDGDDWYELIINKTENEYSVKAKKII